MKIPAFVFLSAFLLTQLPSANLSAQFVQVGEGSYTTVFPGVDVAGRNSYPGGTPLLSGNAASKPVPTNDWWSAKLNQAQVNNLFPYPMALRTTNNGLVLSYIPTPSGSNGSSQPMDDIIPLTVGVSGLNTAQSTVSDFSDFTVSFNWNDGTHDFTATMGIAMPFIYFRTAIGDEALVTVNEGTVTVDNEILLIENVHNGADYAVFAPTGSVWQQDGKNYSADLGGKDYFSAAYLPPDASSLLSVAQEYKAYAFVFPTNTNVSWTFDENSSVVRSHFSVETEVMEGSGDKVLLGLLPHQWAHLAADSPKPESYHYASIRGEIRLLEGNEFYVENRFHGILPTLPYLDNYSDGFNPALLESKISLLENESLATWTDSYNEGQVMNRLIQTARIADISGDSLALKKIVATIAERLEDWLTAEAGEVAFLFYYNPTWTAMIGYPAGHGQDSNLNDHHFHWGYFIHAAAFIEQYQSGWAAKWGGMIDLLIRDAAGTDRNDPMFPYLRNFSPYAGHCWANGFATFPFGNDQESSSESMQFNSALIHWGSITGRNDIRDLGIYLYTTEETAIEEYWFDMHERNFKPEYAYSLVSRIWGNGYDNQTFWTSDIAAAYGIELYPIHGGSLYLGANKSYAEKLWQEITVNTGILSNEANDNLWHDVMWEFQAFTDPAAAIALYNSNPNRSIKFGISDAQTYHWLHAMNALGAFDTTVTADYPVAAVFRLEDEKTYVAQNYGTEALEVHFSDGYTLSLPAKGLYTSRDAAVSGRISSSFPQAFINGSVDLTIELTKGSADSIVLYDGSMRLDVLYAEPWCYTATKLTAGIHSFYARLYNGGELAITNICKVQVGRQLPFYGVAFSVPGTILAGDYDKFEGGNGQDICYHDASVINEGGYRPDEYVDAGLSDWEGSTIGWIDAGEWLEYTVSVQESGYYDVLFRYATENVEGGPMFLLLDEDTISSGIMVNSTGDWDSYQTRTIENVPFVKGEHILKLLFMGGGFNLGPITTVWTAALDYDQPVADAGPNQLVLLPADNTDLDGSGSSDPEGASLNMVWTQLYGPSVVVMDDPESSTPHISNLVEGVYSMELEVSNGIAHDIDEVLIIVSETALFPPVVSITSPQNGQSFIAGVTLNITASATDLDGFVSKVEFFDGDQLIGSSSQEPFSIEWTGETGEHILSALAYDNDGNTAESQALTIYLTDPPSCLGDAPNNEFSYLFSDDEQNPTLTFLPAIEGVGEPTCILYYSTSATPPYPGYNVKPGVPFRLSAAKGSTIYFYYTYSYPNQGEHSTYANVLSYETGTCLAPPESTELNFSDKLSCYPNPFSDKLYLQLPSGLSTVYVYDLNGRLLKEEETGDSFLQLDLHSLRPGIYVIAVKNGSGYSRIKVVKGS